MNADKSGWLIDLGLGAFFLSIAIFVASFTWFLFLNPRIQDAPQKTDQLGKR